MLSLKTLDSDARSQALSPLFTRLPVELRLLIYAFVFIGCRASVELSLSLDELGWDVEGPDWEGRRAERDVCRYFHVGGGFELLCTCRKAYIEGMKEYWSETILTLGCPSAFRAVCDYLPGFIKENVRHLREAKLPMPGEFGWSEEDLCRAPTLLSEFPKLISCAFRSDEHGSGPCNWPGESLEREELLKVPDSEIRAQEYEGVGPFNLESADSGEIPADYIERLSGVRLSDGVTILSRGWGKAPRDCPIDYKVRAHFFNWTTGMVYQTTAEWEFSLRTGSEEDAFQQAMRAQQGVEWSRSYYVLD